MRKRRNIISEEEEDGRDRLSNLPDDIVRHILSFIDMKYAVQISTLSRKFRHIWTSMPYLKLSSCMFGDKARFAKFADNVLSQRNHETELSEVELTFAEPTTQLFVKDIVSYAYLHNVKKLTIIYNNGQDVPEYLLCSHSLEHFTLIDKLRSYHQYTCIPALAWDFPVLKTLNLSSICFSGEQKSFNLFSKCVNLKDLTLDRFTMEIHEFNVCCPQLSNLKLTTAHKFPRVFNVVAPKLKNLTVSVRASEEYRAPTFFDRLQLAQGFDNLEIVNLELIPERYSISKKEDIPLIKKRKRKDIPILLRAFQKIRSAKFLILNSEIIEVLASDMNRLSHKRCPFNNLKCLKIDTSRLSRKESIRISQLANPVKNYLLENSPNATFILELPQEKIQWEQLYNVAKSKEALEEKIHAQDEVIIQQKAEHERCMSFIIMVRMSDLEFQVKAGNPDYGIVRVMGSEIKSVMDSIPETLRLNMEAEFFSQYETLKCSLLNCIDASGWRKVEAELGILRHSTV